MLARTQVAAELNRVRPIEIVRPCFRPWRGGILSLHKVVERLSLLLPATFEELRVVCSTLLQPSMLFAGMPVLQIAYC